MEFRGPLGNFVWREPVRDSILVATGTGVAPYRGMLQERLAFDHEHRTRVILVGHSFGGAVVITVGARSPAVTGVAALSSQSFGAYGVETASPRPLLLIHGEADEVLPDTCSRSFYREAGEPKQLILYPGCLHGLDQCREELDRDLTAWLRAVLAGNALG